VSIRNRKAWSPIVSRAAEIIAEYETAVTLRQVFYRLVAEAMIANSENDYKQLSRLTAYARRNGTFPTLLDRTRTIERPITFDSPVDGLQALADEYRRDRLEGQETLPVLVVEKATLVAQVTSWFDGLSIPVAALRGYASESFERSVMDLVAGELERDVELLYCGDFDPTGEDIPRAFEQNTGLGLRRVALTAEQVDEYELPAAPGKATDSRAGAFVARHGRLVQVELEALPPETLHALLEAELDQLIDRDLVAKAREHEQRERDGLSRLADEWVA
jgi:hypothetical protein